MRRGFLALACLAVSIPLQVQARNVAPVPEPASRPDWSAIKQKAEEGLRKGLFDPEAAQFTWTSGFQWGYLKPALKPHTWAWVACVSVNAKNRLGGYVGPQAQFVAYNSEIGYVWDRADWAVSQCDKPNAFPLQPELINSREGGGVSAADELSKLASLLEKGFITRSEFDEQKAKLLNRGSLQH